MRTVDYHGHPANNPQDLQEPQLHRKEWHRRHPPKVDVKVAY